MRNLAILAGILCFLLLPVRQMAAEEVTETVSTERFMGGFNLRKGLIDLPQGMTQLDVPEEFRYIGPEEARRFLEEGWGNPDGSGTLGMLLPTDADQFGEAGWAVVISYQEDGYISDEDAAEIDYDELLASMRKHTAKANRKQAEPGYQTVSLVGWARPPHYDRLAKKLFWAKELRFEGKNESTLNYNVRILGRQGVLVMNAVSAISQLPLVERRMGQVLAFSEFKDGYRYRDFDPGVDKVAAYGLAALVAGKVATKAGLLTELGSVLLAFKKAVLAGLASLGALLAKFCHRRRIPAVGTSTAE